MAYLAKYLPEVGWEPTVITRAVRGNSSASPGVVRVGMPYATTRVPDNGRARPASPRMSAVKRHIKNVVYMPDDAVSWIPHALAAGIRAHRHRPFDAIVSSAMPASAHIVGSLLAWRLRIPWLADYRDLWNGNPYVDDPPWRARLLVGMEKRTLRRARRITTITDSLAAALTSQHGRRVTTIPNAPDSAEWDGVPFAEPDVFRIVYAGSLYDCRRDPEPLFAQVAALRSEGVVPDLRIDFYGPNPGNLMDLARRHGIDDCVEYHGVIERGAVMRAERSASLLLIIQNSDPRTASEYGSKIFEYQAAGTLILALGPSESVLRSYIDQNDLGWFACSDAEIREAVCAAYRRHVEGRQVRDGSAAAPSARSIAVRFSDALGEMLSEAPRQPSDCGSAAAIGLEKKEPASLR